MAKSAAKSESRPDKPSGNKPPVIEIDAEGGDPIEPPPPELVEPDPDLTPEEAEQARRDYLLTRFWISARSFWGSNGDRLAWIFSIGLLILIVGHVESTGRRDNNVLLSQRRADAIRDILINTFKISSKRLQSVGLGEEQLLDPAHPTSAANQQVQILTVAKVSEQSEPPAGAPAAGAPPPAKKSARKR